MGSKARMTDYERRRLENIKRNDQMLAALNIRSKLSELSAKRQSVQSKSYKRSPEKKPKIETPVVLRRSLRTRGVSPDAATANGVDDDVDLGKKIKKSLQMNVNYVPDKSLREEGPLAMKDAYKGDDGSDSKLIETILDSCRDGLLNKSGAILSDSVDSLVKTEVPETSETGKKVLGSVDAEALQLKSENVARLVPLNKSGAVLCDSVDSLVKTEVPETSETGKKVWGSVDEEALQLKSENVARFAPLNKSGAGLCDSVDSLVKTEVPETSETGKKVWGSVDAEALQLKSENVARLAPLNKSSAVLCDSVHSLVKTEVPETSETGKKVWGSVDAEALQLKSENVARLAPLNKSGAVLCDSVDSLVKTEVPETSETGKKVWGSVDAEALQLKSENVARLVPGKITNVRFFPTRDMHMIAAGNKFGDIGFWHINGKEEDGDGIHLYHPHSGPVSGIVIDPFSISKMYSSCYDGFIRLMDVEKGIFDMVCHSEYCIYSLSLSPHDRRSLYFGEGNGGVNKWDVRAGKSSLSCDLHEKRINTIDFNSENENIMATSSTDRTARIWDLRLVNKDKATPLTTISHKSSVQSAYFSPSGKFLATTSLDDKVGLSRGGNYENTCMVYHYNQTGRWLSTFKGIWGWDDSSIYIGNMKRGVDVISVAGERVVATLESPLVSAIPCRFDVHPYNVGMLACATSGGQVYIWTKP